MAKIDKAVQARLAGFTDEQLDRKVQELKQTIPELNAQLDFAVRLQRDRRAAALRKAVDDARTKAS